jgi:hypothetical protein
MSDGMSEAAAFERQEKELRKAAHALGVALLDTLEGYRGWAISEVECLDMINAHLSDACPGFEVRRKGRKKNK